MTSDLYNHSKEWHDIAFAIENAVRDRHIGLAVTLKRVVALAQELRRTGAKMPTADELRKWNIDRDALKRELVTQKRENKGISSRACL